jgi:hypothetical protein
MKPRLIAAKGLVVLLLCVASTLTAAQTRLDITLEGPWILYTDNTLAKWPVLVAISPGGVSKDGDDTYFHTMSVTAGDGYPVQHPGVYCLRFDTVCGAQGTPSLSSDHYPSTLTPLPVSAPASWDWQSKWTSPDYATAFILPMPTSYSTDGTWYMRFGAQFDASGMTYLKRERHSIGVQLHYDTGPNSFTLQQCATPVALGKCTDLAGTGLVNTGTLSIAMKSPDSNNACDPHVRRAYPKMLSLVGANYNATVAVIDSAIGSDASGNPVYDKDGGINYGCLDNDIQGGTNTMATMSEMGQSWDKQLVAISQFIAEYTDPTNPNAKDPKLADKGLLLSQIKGATGEGKLNRSFPRFSQLTLIETLLSESESRAEALLLEASKSHQAQTSKTKGQPLNAADAQLTLAQLLSLEKGFFDANPPTKNGNDCKAPIMVVQ